LEEATGHFDDLNVLGTNFLRHGDLSICYRTNEVQFSLLDMPTMPSVTVFGLGTSLTVTPATLTAQALKFAIKAMLPNSVTCDAPLVRIKTPEGHVWTLATRFTRTSSIHSRFLRRTHDRARTLCGFDDVRTNGVYHSSAS
jgi:hypothetical protein